MTFQVKKKSILVLNEPLVKNETWIEHQKMLGSKKYQFSTSIRPHFCKFQVSLDFLETIPTTFTRQKNPYENFIYNQLISTIGAQL